MPRRKNPVTEMPTVETPTETEPTVNESPVLETPSTESNVIPFASSTSTNSLGTNPRLDWSEIDSVLSNVVNFI